MHIICLCTVVRVGFATSINPNVSTLSLDQIVDALRVKNVKRIRSPYSEEIGNLNKEMEILKSKKKKTIGLNFIYPIYI